jgi:hypothetical protein
MKRLRKLWRAWLELTSRRERATTLALFRMAVGMVFFATLASLAARGIVSVVWLDQADGGLRAVASGYFLLELLGGPKPSVVWALVAFALTSSACMTLGLGGRGAVLATIVSYRSLTTIGASGGYDSMIFNAAWLLFLSDSTRSLSLDCKRRSGSWSSDDEIPAWPRYVVIVQLVIIYTFTGFQKTSASWTPADGYSALYWFLQDPSWARFDMSWAAWVYPLTQVATFVVWHFETAAPLLLLVYYYRATRDRPGRLRALVNRRDLRLVFTAVGVAMHVGIEILLEMGPFSWISLSYYLCLWRPDEIESLARRAARRFLKGRLAPEPA